MFINTHMFLLQLRLDAELQGEEVIFACHLGTLVFIFTGSVMSPDFLMTMPTISIIFLFLWPGKY